MPCYVHYSITDNSQYLKAAHQVDEWIKAVVNRYYEILLDVKKKELKFYNSMDGPGEYYVK